MFEVHVMPTRLLELKQAIAGYAKTGIELISFDGNNFFPTGLSDDIGLYYIIPKLVCLFDVSPELAIALFFYGIVIASCLVGSIGFLFFCKTWLARVFSVFSLTMFSYVSCRGMTDVYLVQSSVAIAIIPWTLYFLHKKKVMISSLVFLFLSGIVIGYAHYIRSFSSFAVFLFIILSSMFLVVDTLKKKLLLFCVLCFGLVVPFVHINNVIAKRKSFLGAPLDTFEQKHVFWHTVYAGFGLLQNDLGIECNDNVIIKKIEQVEPEAVYPSKLYEAAAKKEVIRLFKEQPQFVMRTLFAKLGIIFYYFLLFANIGLFAAFFVPKPLMIDLIFFISLLFSSLFGFIAIPGRYYLLGFLAFAVLYAIISVEYFLRKYKKGK